ncbi:MAG: hypothetical protein ACRDN6_03120 [Gaiellaceae bacterium]
MHLLTTETPVPPPEAAPPAGRRPMRSIEKAALVVGLLGAVVALIADLLELNPWDGNDSRPAVEKLLTEEDEVVFNVALADYFRDYRKEDPPGDLSRETLGTNGNVLFVDADVEGGGRACCVLHWTLHDPSDGKLISMSQPIDPILRVSGDRPSTTPIWVPLPTGVDAFYVRIGIHDNGDEAPLETVDSVAFPLLQL